MLAFLYNIGFFSDNDFGVYHPPVDAEKAINTEQKKQQKKTVKSKKLRTQFRDIKKNLRIKKI